MAKHQHVHKYERQLVGKKGHEVYRCMLDNCPHFLPTIELAVGRLSLCWGGCGEAVKIDKSMCGPSRESSMIHPMCDNCREERKLRREALMELGKEEQAS